MRLSGEGVFMRDTGGPAPARAKPPEVRTRAGVHFLSTWSFPSVSQSSVKRAKRIRL